MSGSCFYAGIDGGGTKTEIVIVDQDGNERARHRSSTSNQSVVGRATAIATLKQCVAEAARMAGVALPLEHAWFGLAGFDRPQDRREMTPALTALVRSVTITNDAELALTALPGANGVAIVAGTGSIAYGRDARGQAARAGGWGHLFGDEGSGYDLGRRALIAAARMDDGRGPATSLLERLLAHWRLDAPSQLITKVYGDGATKGDIAALADIVVQAASDGDDVATALVADAADELAAAGLAVARRLTFTDGLPLALAGGLLTNVDALRDATVQRIACEFSISTLAVVTDPALSAARAAIQRAGASLRDS